MTINDAIAYAKSRGINARDAEILLGFVIEKSRTFLYTWPAHTLISEEWAKFESLLNCAVSGEPIAYLTGQKEFWSLALTVNQHTLIPRADTEILVETVLTQLPSEETQQILELGTGSGAIALALASTQPHWQIAAVDISAPALAVARENAAQLRINNVEFIESDWFNMIPAQPFDAIISNPPYVSSIDPALQTSLRYEPLLALQSGVQGLDSLQHIIANAGQYLLPGGYLFLEHGSTQAVAVAQCMQDHGWEQITLCHDLAGLPRVTWGRLI